MSANFTRHLKIPAKRDREQDLKCTAIIICAYHWVK